MKKNISNNENNYYSVFVYGENGKKTHCNTNFNDPIEIDARQILDIKSLLSIYIVRNTEFYNEKGLLVRTMESGKTLIVRNIDYNIKLFNFLKPVIEKRCIYFDNENIIAKKTFRIVFTAQSYMKNRHLMYVNTQNCTVKKYIDYLDEKTKKSKNEKVEIDKITKKNILIVCLSKICNVKEEDKLTKNITMKLQLFYSTNIETRVDFYHTFTSLFCADCTYKQRLEKEHNLLEILCLSIKNVENIICLPCKDFVLTSQVQNTIKDIIYYVNHSTPILMIGETGTGKTTLIQTISEYSKYLFGMQTKLDVVNFSCDIDLNDLIGTYQSNDERTMQLLRKLYPFDIQDDKKYIAQLCKHIENESNVEHREYIKKMIENVNEKIIFVEGVLTKAIRNGNWIMFDEINLAPNEILNAICAIVNQKQLYIPEYHGNEFVKFNSNFRIFACMNPGNDYGKKEFDDYNFARIFYDDFASNLSDIELITKQMLTNKMVNTEVMQRNIMSCRTANTKSSILTLASFLSNFFYELKQMTEAKILYGPFLEPLITGRNFTRMLHYIDVLYLSDLFKMFLYTQIHEDCAKHIKELESKYFDLKDKQQCDVTESKHNYTVYDKNKLFVSIAKKCIATNTPVLLQGPTSTGKTSLVTYLSKIYGKLLYRINNHEQTESSDYLGSYTINSKGEIVFKKGIFVQAVENGDWVLLDELNLAPSEVLEVLNRLLDNNKEIVLNGEVIKANKNFRLFATQNLSYGGRKMLSKAFRNRFVELNYNAMTQKDIKHLLDNKKIPRSFQKRMLDIYNNLSSFRSYNMLITVRDLFKWNNRKSSDIEELFYCGLNLLHEKQRTLADRNKIIQIFENVFDIKYEKYNLFIQNTDAIASYLNTTYDLEMQSVSKTHKNEYKENNNTCNQTYDTNSNSCTKKNELKENNNTSNQTYEKNSYETVEKKNEYQENNNTCNQAYDKNIYETVEKNTIQNYYNMTYNTHLFTNKDNVYVYKNFIFTKSYIKLFNTIKHASDNREAVLIVGDTGLGKTKVVDIFANINKKRLYTVSAHQHLDCSDIIGSYTIPFRWNIGPLLSAMRSGSFLLIDEINLAQDSVLERFNSVFEDGREMTILETDEKIKAHESFNIFACMNPGNDFGKKELSPALRNRFTEIYFDIGKDEMNQIFLYLLRKEIKNKEFCSRIIKLYENDNYNFTTVRKISDTIFFIKKLYESKYKEIKVLGVHTSAEMIYKEATGNENTVNDVGWDVLHTENLEISTLHKSYEQKKTEAVKSAFFGVAPYFMQGLPQNFHAASKNMKINAKKIFKAMIYDKGILLKGDPGTGKTTFIENLGKKLRKEVVRINLCDETELTDLCGNFIPVPDEKQESMIIKFVESKMLKALKNSQWIILDEINLASQSVLEGLNSALDYRKKIFLHETYSIGEDARIFATMNKEGAQQGRKSLPKSFLDRFVVVEMNKYDSEDIKYVINECYKHKMSCNEIEKQYLNCSKYFCNNLTLRKALTFFKMQIPETNDYRYKYSDNTFEIGTTNEILRYSCTLDNSFVIFHNEIKNIYTTLKCIQNNIPVIVKGNFGKTMLVNIISKIVQHKSVTISCYEDMDVNDFLGTYQMKNKDIKWNDSVLVNNVIKCNENINKIIVFDNPEKVEKAVFDRLNSLFEQNKSLFIHEKGIEGEIEIEPTVKFIFLCNDLTGLSNAIIDRAWVIELNSDVDEIDTAKMASINVYNCEESKKCSYDNKNYENNKIRDLIDEKEDNLNVSNFDTDVKRCKYNEFSNFKINNLTKTHEINKDNYKILNNLRNTCSIESFPETFYDYKQETKHIYLYQTIDEREIENMIHITHDMLRLLEHEQKIYEKTNYNQLTTFYKKICYQTKIYNTDYEKVGSFGKQENKEHKIINFMKNRNLSMLTKLPNNVNDLKMLFLQSIRTCKIEDYKNIKLICDTLRNVDEIENVHFDRFYDEFTGEICGIYDDKVFDPVVLLKIEYVNECLTQIRNIQEKFRSEFKNVYKYGKARIEEIVHELEVFYNTTNEIISTYNKKLERNIQEHVKSYKNNCVDNASSFIHYLSLLHDFQDITDYSFIKEYNKNCDTEIIQQNSLYFLYIIANEIKNESEIADFIYMLTKMEIELYPELCKSIFYTSKSFCEMINMENKCIAFPELDTKSIANISYDLNKILNTIFDEIIDNTNTYGIHFYDMPCIRIGNIQKRFESIKEIQEQNIYTKPEDIIESYKTKIAELNNFYKKMQKCLTYDFNYISYVKLYKIEFTIENITEYFLNTKVHQFLERMYFVGDYIQKHAKENKQKLNLLYNLSLQYKSFDFEKTNERIKKSIERKICYSSKEIKLYTKFLEDETINQIKDIAIDENIYICTCRSVEYSRDTTNNTLDILLDNLSVNKNEFSKDKEKNNTKVFNDINHDKDRVIQDGCTTTTDKLEIESLCTWKYQEIDKSLLNYVKNEKSNVYEVFLQRNSDEKYSENEILLGKVINEYINVSKYFTKDVLSTIEELIRIYITNKLCVNYLLYVFRVMSAYKEYNDDNTGDGMKEGTGEKNISEKVKNEDEIQNDDNYEEPNEVQESDGIEMSNEGEINEIEDSEENEESEDSKECEDLDDDDIGDNDGSDETIDNEGIDEDNDDEGNQNNDMFSEMNDTEDKEPSDANNESCDTDCESITESGSNAESLSDVKDDDKTNNEEDDNNEYNATKEYRTTEDIINEDQTCSYAENYNTYVQGKENEENGLEEGNGADKIETNKGNTEEGTKAGLIQKRFDNRDYFNKHKNESFRLANYLRNILEGNKKNKYNGNFKSGKKLNMKRIVPFILSDYKKDKIWLRRNTNDKREYVLRFFIDASQSMNDESLVCILFNVLKKVTKAFEILEIKYEIYKFGAQLKKYEDIKDFVDNVSFNENETNLDFVRKYNNGINLVLTDGIFQVNYERNENFLLLLIDKKGIKDLKKIVVQENRMEIKKYLDSITMRYCIIEDAIELEYEFVNALSEMIKIMK